MICLFMLTAVVFRFLTMMEILHNFYCSYFHPFFFLVMGKFIDISSNDGVLVFGHIATCNLYLQKEFG